MRLCKLERNEKIAVFGTQYVAAGYHEPLRHPIYQGMAGADMGSDQANHQTLKHFILK